MGIKTKLLPQKIFDNDLLAIHKSEVTLTLNKPTHDGMCILDLNKVLMCTNSIIVTLKTNIATIHDYYSHTLMV